MCIVYAGPSHISSTLMPSIAACASGGYIVHSAPTAAWGARPAASGVAEPERIHHRPPSLPPVSRAVSFQRSGRRSRVGIGTALDVPAIRIDVRLPNRLKFISVR